MRKQRKEWDVVRQWLARKLFHTGETSTGWVSVSRGGIVAIVSDSRVRISWRRADGTMGEMRTDYVSLPWMREVVAMAERDMDSKAEADAANNAWRTSDGE